MKIVYMSPEMLEIHININKNCINFNPEKAIIFSLGVSFIRFVNS